VGHIEDVNPVTRAAAQGHEPSAPNPPSPGTPGEGWGEGLSAVENRTRFDINASVDRPVLEYRDGSDEAESKGWDEPQLTAAALGYLAIIPITAVGFRVGQLLNEGGILVILATALGLNLSVAALAYCLSSHPLWRAACSGYLTAVVVTLSLVAVGLMMSG